MEISILNLIHKRIPTARILVGVGLVTILALMIVMAAGTAQAIDNGTKGSGILLAANDAHAADAAKEAVKKDAKAAPAKKDAAKAEEKSYGPVGSIFNYFAKNPFAYIFLALALGYPLGRVKIASISLGTTA